MQAQTTQCPVCCVTSIAAFLTILHMPVHCNLLWPTRAAAIDAPRGDMQLGFCPTCGHVFNMTFDPALMEYTQQYENSLHFSPRFQSYADALATRLLETYQLYNKDIVEIGSGKGEFLTLLCAQGRNRGIGFDPSYIPDPQADAQNERITFIQDLYAERYTHYRADLVCCRHVLEHIQYPREFMRTVRRTVGDRYDTIVFFEVPNALFMLRDLSVWDFIYEHCSYFCAGSLAYLFATAGFQVLRLSEEFGSQFLSIEARTTASPTPETPERWHGLDHMTHAVAIFADKYRQKVSTWTHHLEQFQRTGQRAVLWGAGSKGVTFLNTIATGDRIEYIVDINARKQGMYVAGSGQRIVAPEFLTTYKPDVVIVMNPLYVDEIRQMTGTLGLTPEVLSV